MKMEGSCAQRRGALSRNQSIKILPGKKQEVGGLEPSPPFYLNEQRRRCCQQRWDHVLVGRQVAPPPPLEPGPARGFFLFKERFLLPL